MSLKNMMTLTKNKRIFNDQKSPKYVIRHIIFLQGRTKMHKIIKKPKICHEKYNKSHKISKTI